MALGSPAAAAPELMKPREPGDLDVIVAAAYSPDYIREWLTTKYEESPSLTGVHETSRGKWLFVSFLVTGLTPSAELAYDFEAGFRLLRPDGSILFDEPSYARNRSKGAARRGFVMSDPALDLLFDATDPIGKYTLEVVVRDKIAGTEAKESYEIHLRHDV
jgi:hypothetical protein